MNIKHFQEKLVEMLGWFHNFCVEHNLTYYVSSGTMLGAARHQGMIPWDDDIDVIMPREDIKRLEQLMDNTGRYVLESPTGEARDYLYSCHKIYDTTTTLVENTRAKIKRGIFLDIFPIDGMGNTEEEVQVHFNKIRRKLKLLNAKAYGYNKLMSFWKKVAIFIFRFIPLNEKKLQKEVSELCQERSCSSYKLCGNPIGAYKTKEIMPMSIYGKPTLYDFDGIKVYGVEHADEYLTRLYGDWRKLPPEEKRISNHDFILLDLENGYLQ